MKKIIYVSPLFKQQETDLILFACPGFVEIETENEKIHESFVLNLSSEEAHREKLDFCINQRKIAYSKLNQDEMRFDDEINGTTTWIDTIKEIKERFPKPSLEGSDD